MIGMPPTDRRTGGTSPVSWAIMMPQPALMLAALPPQGRQDSQYGVIFHRQAYAKGGAMLVGPPWTKRQGENKAPDLSSPVREAWRAD